MDVASSEDDIRTEEEQKQIESIRDDIKRRIQNAASNRDITITCIPSSVRNFKGLADEWKIENCNNYMHVLSMLQAYIPIENYTSSKEKEVTFAVAHHNYLAKSETIVQRILSNKFSFLESVFIFLIIVLFVQCMRMLCSDGSHLHMHT